jgi:hypothetical protein
MKQVFNIKHLPSLLLLHSAPNFHITIIASVK